MKKYILAVALLLIAPSVSLASITTIPTSPQPQNTSIQVLCSVGDVYSYFESGEPSGVPFGYGLACGSSFLPPLNTDIGILILECDSTTSPECLTDIPQQDLRNLAGYISEATMEIVGGGTPPPPPPPTPHGIAILGGTAPSVGTPYDGLAMKAGVASAVQGTMDGLNPIIVLVVGLILTFIIILNVIILFRKTDQ